MERDRSVSLPLKLKKVGFPGERPGENTLTVWVYTPGRYKVRVAPRRYGPTLLAARELRTGMNRLYATTVGAVVSAIALLVTAHPVFLLTLVACSVAAGWYGMAQALQNPEVN